MTSSTTNRSVSESYSSSGSNEDNHPSMRENSDENGRDTFVSVETIDYSTSTPHQSDFGDAATAAGISIDHPSNESNRSSMLHESSHEIDRCTLLSVETIDYSTLQPFFSTVYSYDSNNDGNTFDCLKKSVVNDENQPRRPEYVPNGEEPLPPRDIRAESAEDSKVTMKKTTYNSSTVAKEISDRTRDTTTVSLGRTMEYMIEDDEAPLPPGIAVISGSPDDRKAIKFETNHSAETDVEAQTAATLGIAHVSEPPTIRRKVLYPEEIDSEPKTKASSSQPRAFILRYMPWYHPSNLGDVPVPGNDSRRKMRNALATMIVATAIASIFAIVLVTTTNSNKSDDVTTTQTSHEDVISMSPPTDLPNTHSHHVDNYNSQICNPVDGEDVEFCTIGTCFSGPHCSCEIYLRQSQSNDVIGFCDSCRVCDFDGNIGFDCGNLGSSVQECPSAASATDFNAQVVEYSPPENYIDRFCTPGLDQSTELCFAGECTDDAACQCDMYKREVASGDTIGLCDSCGVCASGGISSDCTNIGLAKVDCRLPSTEEAEEFVYSPSDMYTNRFCIQGFDPSVELCFAGECTNDESCQCDMFKRAVDSGGIIGVCDSCKICADGGISHDCTNIGSSDVTCRDYSYIEIDTDSRDYSTPQLSQGKNNTSSSSVEGPEPNPGTYEYAEKDYTCADPSNGVQLCQAQLCDDPGCICDAYFRDTFIQQPVGTCSSCTVCDNGAIGLVCSIYGIEMDLSC